MLLALVLAGGQGGRLGVLTERRAKPAVAFGGSYRLIDFALSNLAHSGVSDVWVVEQYRPHGLNAHLAGGRPWDLDRTRGGLQVLPPYQTREHEPDGGFAEGNADAIFQHRAAIRAAGPDHVLVLSADHVYAYDFRHLLSAHEASGADVTFLTTEVEPDDATRYGIVGVARGGRVTRFDYKPEKPRGTTAAAEVFLYRTGPLLDALEDLDRAKGSERLGDYGHELVPHFVDAGRAHAVALEGYWRDVGTVEAYVRAHFELLQDPPPLRLDDPAWPFLTAAPQRVPARLHAGSRVAGSLVSAGCSVRGTVEHSILGPGVRVAEGARVRGSILLHDVEIGPDAHVSCAVVDERAVVGARARVGSVPRGVRLGEGVPPLRDDQVALVGAGARVAEGAVVRAGARVVPGA